MPLLHCSHCQHEWEDTEPTSKCSWCGHFGYVLAAKTDLEVMLDSDWWKKKFQQKSVSRKGCIPIERLTDF